MVQFDKLQSVYVAGYCRFLALMLATSFGVLSKITLGSYQYVQENNNGFTKGFL